jgi:alpha-1,6-mannosyltransferase
LWEYKRRTIQDSDITIHVLSDWMKDMIISSPIMRGKRVRKIPIGLDLMKFAPVRDGRPDLRHSMGIPKDAFVIMLRASKNPFKGLDIAKEILSRLSINREVVVLTIERRNLLEAIGNRITVIDQGGVNEEELVRSYQVSDCLLATSTAESFGVMGVESMACGCPVVCLKGTALEQVLSDSKALISFNQGDVAKAVEEIKNLSENPIQALEMANVSRKFVEERFEIRRQVASLVELYEEILND